MGADSTRASTPLPPLLLQKTTNLTAAVTQTTAAPAFTVTAGGAGDYLLLFFGGRFMGWFVGVMCAPKNENGTALLI